MKISLSTRLQACAAYVKNGDRIADIGCDHGYLSLYLLKNKIVSFAIAADVNEMPLQSAKLNAQKYGCSDRISFHLSDGAQNIPRDFDTMICAGMGADTIVSILAASSWLKNSRYRLILQCQSKTPMLRNYLSDNGWHIVEEQVLRDGRFLYTVMNVQYDPQRPRLTDAQCHFPPALLVNPTKETHEYYEWIINGLKIQVQHKEDPQITAILNELTKENSP